MRLQHCPDCLSRDAVYILVWPNEIECRRCKRVPECQLSPPEIRECLKEKWAAAGVAVRE